MKAIYFTARASNYLLGKGLGKLTESAYFGALSGVRFGNVDEHDLPGDDWVRLEILKAGICGTDVGALLFKASPVLEPFGSFPAVLGHEILARVLETGPAVKEVRNGQRVMVDPLISCTMRGYPDTGQCPSCSGGNPGTCGRAGDAGLLEIDGARLERGASVGYHASLSGGWAERMIAHESQLHPVDDSLDDRTAVLIEPFSVGMHAVLNERPFPDGPVLVIGSGAIAFGTIWSLRAAGYEGELVAQVEPGNGTRLALELGASSVVSPGEEAHQALLATGAKPYKPVVGNDVFAGGGFPLIFDCVGSEQTVKQCVLYAAARGEIVMLGCAYQIPRLDLTFVWARELTISGYVGYGLEDWRGERLHSFRVTHALLLETNAPVARVVTNVFPLARYKDALSTAINCRKTGSIKVLLDPAV